MKPTDFATQLTKFLGDYSAAQRNLSSNTIKAYRDTFTLLLRFCRDKQRLSPEKVTLDRLDAPLVLAFLTHLQKERNCGARTRNQRLSAVHAFFRYLQAEAPNRLAQCQQILAIPCQRCERPTVNYLAKEDLAAILAQPDLTTPEGRRDAVLLSVLYDTGARVQELLDLHVGDVRLDSPAQVRLTGKGRKTRVVPLLPGTVELLTEYLSEHGLDQDTRANSQVFFNRSGEKLSRSGVRYILTKYTEKARSQRPAIPVRVFPHSLRHSKAMHLLHAGNPPTAIQGILGHADIRTTDIYARANMEMKRRALEKAAGTATPTRLPSWQENKDLLNWLRSL